MSNRAAETCNYSECVIELQTRNTSTGKTKNSIIFSGEGFRSRSNPTQFNKQNLFVHKRLLLEVT